MPCCGALHRSDAVGLKRGPTNRLLRTGWPRLHRDEDVNRSVGAPRSRLRYQFSRYSDVIEPIRGMGRPLRSPGSRRRSTLAVPPVFITRAIEAKPFPSAPSVVIAYPHIEDWWNRSPELRRAGWVNRNKEWLYQEYKGVYQDSVLKRLRQIQHRATGRAVLAELRAALLFGLHFPVGLLAVPRPGGPKRPGSD